MKNTGLTLLPLGGLGEFGMNLMVLQSGQDAIIIDCGMMFSDGRHAGIDIILPDFSYLLDPKLNFQAMILTHGHEDHIGAVPFLFSERPVPMYGSAFTMELVRKKLSEFQIKEEGYLHTVEKGEKISTGTFGVEWIEVAHSIPDAYAVCVDTPQGKIIHTGDFKIDDHHPDGKKTDLKRMSEISKEGVYLLLSDSTNAPVPGSTVSEDEVKVGLEDCISQSKAWTIVATFSSHVPRVVELFEIAKRQGKKVFPLGRSMVGNIEIAKKLGYLKNVDNILIDEKTLKATPRDQVMIICTGTQGEYRSALHRLSKDQFRNIKIQKDDTVIFSSRAIPGRERSIYYMIDELYRKGARVITDREFRVHTSGHGYSEDLKTVLRTVQPKFFIPCHGEYRMLDAHKALALEVGMQKDNVFLIEDGQKMFFQGDKVQKGQRLDLKPLLVDKPYFATFDEPYLKERRRMAEEGVLVVQLLIDQAKSTLLDPPLIETRGLCTENEEDMFDDLISMLERKYSTVKGRDVEKIEEDLRIQVQRFFKNEINRSPLIVPIVQFA
ncbi:MAG: ribonuclease J [Bdellovibrionales bacterium]|nr:ribonuclease J [Bdellovibrionales bacterium]